ncbi:MAG: hypothetical protein RIT14_2014 [Pseudomonadota bacterium]
MPGHAMRCARRSPARRSNAHRSNAHRRPAYRWAITRLRRLGAAALLGLGPLLLSAPPLSAQSLRLLTKDVSETLAVPVNRAVVVESAQPFAEVSIANPGIADISSLSNSSIYVLGKSPGRTTMTLLSASGALIANVDVQVTPDLAEIKDLFQQIFPGERIEVRSANDGIVLSGSVSSLEKLGRALDLAELYAPDRVSNLLSVSGTQQVMLTIRFAEMQRSVAKNLSSSLMVVGPDGQAETGSWLNGDNSLTSDSLSLRADANSVALLTVGAGSLELGVLLEALETRGLVRTLAEPNLTALSGQSANFLAGGEYPIPVVGDNGTTVEYRPFGVQMDFTPTVLDGGLINLDLSSSVTSLDASVTSQVAGTVLAAFKNRSAKTTVELRDGESFAIAGLLQDDFLDLNSQVPFLGDVPILGALFRSAKFQRAQSELVVIVTAHLVSPTRGTALVLPTDRIRAPTEAELFLFGRTEGSGPVAEVARQDFSGPYGYVME